ncbi:MAG: anti-sigma-factor antagonist [Firmicutes bacterium]|nr:anti-sigma-factor antagonist [Bacillota bacterium]
MNITTLVKQGILVVRVEGEMDMHLAEQFRNTVDAALETSGVKHMILSLKGVTFIDSSGVGVILGRYKKITALGGNLMIVNAKPQVARVLEVSGMLRIMKLYNSETEAVESL